MSTVDRMRMVDVLDADSKDQAKASAPPLDVLGVYKNQTTCSICHSNGLDDDPLLPTRHSNSTSEPPVWASRFHVNFTEFTQQGKTARTYVFLLLFLLLVVFASLF